MIEIRWHGRGGQGAVTSIEMLALAAIAGGVTVVAALRLAGVTTSGFWNANTWGLLASAALFGIVFAVRKGRSVG